MYILKSIIGCYYSYHNTCIAVGKVSVDKNQNRNLIIDEYRVENNLSVWEAANIMKKYSLQKWINKHEPLRLQLGYYCNQVDFRGDNENELDAIKDLFFSLESTEGLIIPNDFDLSKSYIYECLNILLKGLISIYIELAYNRGQGEIR